MLTVGRQSLRHLDPGTHAPIAIPDIFLSFSREDAPTASRFAESFKALGFEVWWDVTPHAGQAYDEVTEGTLRAAKAVVVLWSKRSVASRWVRAEATLGDRNGTLLPAMIEACERPVMFELTQTADLSHWQGEPTTPAGSTSSRTCGGWSTAASPFRIALASMAARSAPMSGRRRRRAFG